uniref:CW domain-containing protein n=1 Tax=Caenorhabditis tropicalis TaxID=1561998 RepID=A0A1I7UYF4_9PELO
MIVIFGSVTDQENSGKKGTGDWETCLEECLETWNCALISQTPTGCIIYSMNEIKSIETSDEGDEKVAFKSNSETCSTGIPPLFGEISSSIIETNGVDFYRTEITESSENILNFNFTIHKCTKDIPKDYTPLDLVNPMKYFYPLTSPFTPEETFFMRGKISETLYWRFTISFYNRNADNWPLYIRVQNESPLYNVTQFQVCETGEEDYTISESVDTYYELNEEFEIRVSSSDTQAFITLKDTVFTFNLLDYIPLPDTTDFVINWSAYYGIEKVTLDYIGWTGNCWFEPIPS